MTETTFHKRQEEFESTVNYLIEKLPEESSTRKQLHNYVELFEDSSSYLANKEHRLAFIGNIGAGKTTAICHILNLLNEKEPILSTGSGRTTLCEVNIQESDQLKIIVEPYTPDEVHDYLKDFSLYLSEYGSDKPKGTNTFKLSAEIERALRNMMDLKVKRRKDNEGKRITNDTAKEFASKYNDPVSLTKNLLDRIDLESRTQTLFVNGDEEISQNKWLHETFKSINSATNANVGLAKKIDIYIPQSLFNDIDFSLSVADTKGVDQTVNRQDLDDCLTDDRTVSVICCRFNDAPDKTMSGILKAAKTAGLADRIPDETILLVLDRNDEAKEIIDIDEAVGDKDEGREIRGEQIKNDLRQTLQLDSLDIQFLDAKSDEIAPLAELFPAKVSALRNIHKERLVEIESAISDIKRELISQSAQQAKRQVKKTLEPWLKKAQSCSPVLKEYFLSIISDITLTHAGSVRGCVNHRGEWHNLDYYQCLANGSRQQVVEQVNGIKDELITLIDNMLSQNDLQPAYALLKQLKYTTNKRLGVMYQQVFTNGRSVYEIDLSNDTEFWNLLQSEWGGGSGYKERIKRGSEQWFQNNTYTEYESKVTESALKFWNQYVLEVQELLGASLNNQS